MPFRPRQDYVRTFNRVLGNRQNRPITQQRVSGNTREEVQRGGQGTRRRIQQGLYKPPTPVRKRYESVYGKIGGNAKGQSTAAETSLRRTLNSSIQAIEEEAIQNYQQKISLIYAEQQHDKGGLMESFGNSPVGRALDLWGRGSHALAGAQKYALNEAYDTREEGNKGSIWSRLWDVQKAQLGGAWKGLSGQDKVGWGEPYEIYKNRDPWGGEALRDLEEAHPAVEQKIAQAVGLGGELFLDPTNYVGVGLIDEVTKGGLAGARKLTRATEESLVAGNKEIAEHAIRQYVDDVYNNYPNASAWRASPDSLVRSGTTAAEDIVRETILQVRGGSKASRGRSYLNPRLHGPATANRVTEAVRKTINADLDEGSQFIIDSLRQGNQILPHQIDKWMNASDDFKDFMTKIDDALVAEGRIPSGSGMDDVLDALKKSDTNPIRKIADDIRETYDIHLQQIRDGVLAEARNPPFRSLSIRIGDAHIPLRVTGKAYQTVAKVIPEGVREAATAARKAISFEHNFPGKISLLTQKAHALGVKNADEFRKTVQDYVRKGKFSVEESIRLQHALHNGTVFMDKRLEDARLWLRSMYDQILTDEWASGARNTLDGGKNIGYRKADNYAYVFNRKNGADVSRSAWKTERKGHIHTNGTEGRFTTEAAKHAGLKPVENAFEALNLRRLKSQREMTRAYFHHDIMDNYGIHAQNIGDAALRKRGLVQVNYDRLRADFRKTLDDQGGHWYIPKEHAKMIETYNQLTKWNSASMGRVARAITQATNLYKASVTMPFTGFHIRNMVGDVFMGLLDGVNPKIYEELSRKMARGGAKWKISDTITKTTDEIRAMYEEYAAGGFVHTDLQMMGQKSATAGAVSSAWHGTGNKLRGASQWREDFGRIGHFVDAFREEARALEREGLRDPAAIERRARDAAVWRVNHFKFDYNAVTALERQIKTLAFPFYTFTRKAVPTLVEQLFLNPHYMSMYDRFQSYNDGTAADGLNHYMVPRWLQDAGYAKVPGGTDEEPYLLSGDFLPTNVLNTLDFTNSQKFSSSLISQVSPLALALPEIAANKRFFDERPTGDFWEYMWNKVSLPQQVGRAAENATSSEDPAWLQLLNRRFMGAGIPVRRLTTEQQAYAQQAEQDRYVDDPFREFNRSQENFSLYEKNTVGRGTTYVLRNKNTGQTMGEFSDPSQAVQVANQVGG